MDNPKILCYNNSRPGRAWLYNQESLKTYRPGCLFGLLPASDTVNPV
jgi:hypothetical protein